MENNILVRDDKYEGKYVAFVSIADHTVIAQGDDAQHVMDEAKSSGAEHPMLIYIPDKDMTCCF